MPMRPVLFWFRRDLRLADNIALARAVDTGRPVIPVYISDSQDAGGASRWWLHHSLARLDKALRQRGSPLVVRSGAPERTLADLAAATGADVAVIRAMPNTPALVGLGAAAITGGGGPVAELALERIHQFLRLFEKDLEEFRIRCLLLG